MPDCPTCGRHLARTHRNALQRLIYRETFRCPKCRGRVSRLHQPLDSAITFYFSRYTHCIRCGNPKVHRVSRRDRVDSVSPKLASRILHLTGAPLNKCPACRLQYYDWRRVEPDGGSPQRD